MNTSTRRISTRESKDGSHEIEVREEEGRDGCSDEEIPSDFSDEEDATASEKEELGKRERETSLAGTARGRRLHRYQKEWKSSHEDYIQKIHERFVPFRNETISKWNEKLKLSSGKINSKVSLKLLYSKFTVNITVLYRGWGDPRISLSCDFDIQY